MASLVPERHNDNSLSVVLLCLWRYCGEKHYRTVDGIRQLSSFNLCKKCGKNGLPHSFFSKFLPLFVELQGKFHSRVKVLLI
jgi:hypothetical protein